MPALFIASLIAGLVYGVRVMLVGVERPRNQHPAGERSFRLSPAVLVSFLLVFGITGYVVSRRTEAVGAMLLWASGLALVAAVATARLVTKWWGVVPEHDVDDERYILQGQVARVVTAIAGGGVGEVEFQTDGQRRQVRARGIAGDALPVGTEVVIERVEDDVAYVESWSKVEQRL